MVSMSNITFLSCHERDLYTLPYYPVEEGQRASHTVNTCVDPLILAPHADVMKELQLSFHNLSCGDIALGLLSLTQGLELTLI